MRPVLIYFRETHLDENNKFTLDFSDQEFVQEIEFLSKNKYYITSLNCKLKLKEYICEDEKIKIEKTIRDGQIYSPYSQFLGKDFNFDRKLISGLNLIVRLNEEQTLIDSFSLHRSQKCGTQYLNLFLGRANYRDKFIFCIRYTI